MKWKGSKRTHKHFVLQYVVLPVVLVGSDMFIAVFSHFSGSRGLGCFLSLDAWSWYFSNKSGEFLFFVAVAICISLLVEYIVQDIERL